MSAEAGDEFGVCQACGDDDLVLCSECEHVPAEYAWICGMGGIEPLSPFGRAVWACCYFYRDDEARAIRVLRGAGVADEFGAAYALGGRDAAVEFVRGLGIPGVGFGLHCITFDPPAQGKSV
jgi:hypothetical protein